MRTDGLVYAAAERTPVCNLLLDQNGDLISGVADMSAAEVALTPGTVLDAIPNGAKIVAIDANVQPSTLLAVVRLCFEQARLLLYEPTSTAKCARLVDAYGALGSNAPAGLQVDYVTPNHLELITIADKMFEHDPALRPWTQYHPLNAEIRGRLHGLHNDASAIAASAVALSTLAKTQFIKLGPHGVLIVSQTGPKGKLEYAHLVAPRLDPSPRVFSTGAGDTFTGAILPELVCLAPDALTMAALVKVAERGQAAAAKTLATPLAVAADLMP